MMMMDPVTSSRFTDQDQQLKAATPRMAPLPADSAFAHHTSKRSASDSPVTEVCEDSTPSCMNHQCDVLQPAPPGVCRLLFVEKTEGCKAHDPCSCAG